MDRIPAKDLKGGPSNGVDSQVAWKKESQTSQAPAQVILSATRGQGPLRALSKSCE